MRGIRSTLRFIKIIRSTLRFITAFKKTPDFHSGDELTTLSVGYSPDMSSSFKGNTAFQSGEDIIKIKKIF